MKDFDWSTLGLVCLFLLIAVGLHVLAAAITDLDPTWANQGALSRIATVAWYTGAVCVGMSAE